MFGYILNNGFGCITSGSTDSMKKILIIQTAFPGDAILTLPMIQKLSEREQDSLIDVMAIPSTSEIFQSSPFVNNVLIIDKRKKDKSVFSVFRIAKKIRMNNYDMIISPHRSFRTSMIVLLSRVEETIGFEISSFSWVYKYKIKHDLSLHEVQRNLSLIGEKNSGWKIQPEVKMKTVVGILPENFCSGKIVAIAPGSVWETKKYPKEYFEQIVLKLIDKKYSVLLIGGKEDIELCESLNNSDGEKIINLAGKLSIVESISILKKCSLLISNDSAPTHMGMAAGIPVLTIYCSTIPAFGFYPFNNKSRFLSYDNLSCKPCGIHGHKSCPLKTFECAKQLKPEFIYNEIEIMLNE